MNAARVKLSGADIGIIVLTVATAAIHFSRAIADPEIRVLFILNGLGYLALLSAIYLPFPWFAGRRKLAHRLLIGYVALTIILWGVWVAMSGEATALGIVDKLIEIALIGLLWWQRRQAR
jgi:hypothetical protein